MAAVVSIPVYLFTENDVDTKTCHSSVDCDWSICIPCYNLKSAETAIEIKWNKANYQ